MSFAEGEAGLENAVRIELVRNADQARAARRLAHEFVAWLRGRYPEMASDIDTYLARQNFHRQIRDVLTHFNPPKGECLLARRGKDAVGVLMLKDAGGGTCEMNRMFVREEARGLGAGRALVERLKERAREMGFSCMVLGALPRHHEALALYRSCGFEIDDSLREEGESHHAILMRLELGGRGG